jgi:hypothetical protein
MISALAFAWVTFIYQFSFKICTHPSKCSSVKHVLSLTFFALLNSCSQRKILPNTDDINKTCFLISGNVFHQTEWHSFATNVYTQHKTHLRVACVPHAAGLPCFIFTVLCHCKENYVMCNNWPYARLLADTFLCDTEENVWCRSGSWH